MLSRLAVRAAAKSLCYTAAIHSAWVLPMKRLPRPYATEFRLSVAIPIHDEETALPELLTRLRTVLDGLHGGASRVVFVDDGSVVARLRFWKKRHGRIHAIVVLSLSRTRTSVGDYSGSRPRHG